MSKLNPAVVRVAATAALATVTVAPALAHPGDHHGMSFGELAAHLSSGWHLAVVVAAAFAGIAVVVLGARREARARLRQPRRKS